MKSVGEAMAIGRTFREALGKAMRSLETGRAGFDLADGRDGDDLADDRARDRVPTPDRLFQSAAAFRLGLAVERVARADAHRSVVPAPDRARSIALEADARSARALGEHLAGDCSRVGSSARASSDRRLAALTGTTEAEVRARAPRGRHAPGLQARRHLRRRVRVAHAVPVLDRTRTSARRAPTDRTKVMILGGGPNRIGQGIEFDYCCVHAAMALREEGIETIMVNCNPETVSTDYDTSDRLYFEPLTLEDVLEICEVEKPVGA